MNLYQALLQSWTWRLAWRDSRSSRRRLFLYSLSISLGIAALVAVGSLGQSLQRAVDQQSKALLGADIVVSSRQPFGEAEEALLQRLGTERSDEISFASMLSFPGSGGTRLINVRALRGPFPWYGQFEAEPPSAIEAFRQGEGLLVEEGVARQFNAQVGDPVKLGEWNTRIVGLLRSVPGDSFAFATLAPRVYMAFDRLDSTELLGRGSLVRYRSLFRLPEDPAGQQLIDELSDPLKELRLDIDTAEKRRENIGRTASNLNGFLNLVAFIALLLGAVGVASAVQVHVRQRLPQVAVLRCLGAPMAATFAVYLIQAVALGAVGVVTGILLGALVQRAVPAAFASLIPFPIDVRFSVSAAAQAAVAGLVVSSTFALLPLLEVRRVSPLAAIRVAFDPARSRSDPARWMVIAAIAGAVVTFALLQTREVRHGLGFAGGLAAAFLLLTGAARLLVILSRRLVPGWLPFAWRQGLASLHRPQNRTGTLLVSLGLGTFLILSLQLTRSSLLQALSTPPGEKRANAILFDVQSDQVDGIGDILQRLNLPLLDGAPIVTMRLASLKDRPVSEWLTNSTDSVPGWVLRREYRSTWRSNLVDSERLLRGNLSPRIDPETSPVPVSVESGIAEDLGIDLGDRLTFDVQGVALDCVVGSIREVEWRQVRPNFFVVFPEGALEAAPSMHILATSISNATESANLQREVVGQFPNVSVIDLTLVLSTVEGVVAKVALAIRFMALFTIGTGIVVLAGAVVTGRWQRMQEAILLRTLGASQAQIRRILIAEYAGLGLLAALTGSLLALGSGWALAHLLFKVPFQIQASDLLLTLVAVPLLTVIVGLAASRGISSHPPLEILRRES